MNETESKTLPMSRRLGLLAGAAISAMALLASGCSDSNESSNSSGTTGGDAIVTGSAECNRASMQEAVESWEKAFGGGTATLPETSDSYRCADGWAVAFPDVGPAESSVTVTAVFEAEGQFWIPKDRAKVCGATAEASEVPASLFEEACRTN